MEIVLSSVTQPVTQNRYTVRLSVVSNDFAATITRHNIIATDSDAAVLRARELAENETGRSDWELEDPNGVEETDQKLRLLLLVLVVHLGRVMLLLVMFDVLLPASA